MTDSEIIKILSEAWDAAEGTVQARLTRQEKSAVEMWLDDVALENTDTVELLKSENAYLMGIIEAYEEFLKSKGYLKEEE